MKRLFAICLAVLMLSAWTVPAFSADEGKPTKSEVSVKDKKADNKKDMEARRKEREARRKEREARRKAMQEEKAAKKKAKGAKKSAKEAAQQAAK